MSKKMEKYRNAAYEKLQIDNNDCKTIQFDKKAFECYDWCAKSVEEDTVFRRRRRREELVWCKSSVAGERSPLPSCATER